ncbi:MAG TPA: dTDP-glucose 4,6-dehydratase [Candidatus Acidoferrales bacterium]|nr:dTDP-glucose 4,6-dehydratase [Candidatus Acidoferrales bacterium]
MNLRSILVTGGAGFIGSNFIRFFLEKHDNVDLINLDKLTYAGNLESLRDVESNPRYHFYRGDISDAAFVKRLFHEWHCDAIVNFAAESHVDRSILGPQVFIETNVRGTMVLLEAAREFGVEKFLQVSTDEVYGSLGAKGKFTEANNLSPNSPYSASKASADVLVRAWLKTFNVPTVITRCSNNYGPFQFPEKFIPLMIINAMQNRELPIYGDGENVRDWIFVEDHCEAIDTVLYHGVVGEIYNIGGGNEIRNIEMAKLILKRLGKPESLLKFVKDRPGHDRRYAMDSSKIEIELRWKPHRSFEEGIEETIRWYTDHEDWWRRIISGEYQHYYKLQYEGR